MDNSQLNVKLCEGDCPGGKCGDEGSLVCRRRLWSLNNDKDVGSKGDLQEPENKKSESMEVKPLSESQNGQAEASPHQAQGGQGIVPIGGPERAPTQIDYPTIINRIESLGNQVRQTTQQQVSQEAKLAEMSKKLSEIADFLQKQRTAEAAGEAEEAEEGEEGEDGQEAEAAGEAEEGQEAALPPKKAKNKLVPHKRPSGAGIVAVDELKNDALGNYKWFGDLLKARNKMLGMK
jgi:hypothetical protein